MLRSPGDECRNPNSHSEMNPSKTEVVKTLQLWVFPEKENVIPRYDQKSFDIESQINTFVTVVSLQIKMMGMRSGCTTDVF